MDARKIYFATLASAKIFDYTSEGVSHPALSGLNFRMQFITGLAAPLTLCWYMPPFQGLDFAKSKSDR